MSIETLYVVMCDCGDCSESSDSAISEDEARMLAIHFGWRQVDRDGKTIDLCPHCAENCQGEPDPQ